MQVIDIFCKDGLGVYQNVVYGNLADNCHRASFDNISDRKLNSWILWKTSCKMSGILNKLAFSWLFNVIDLSTNKLVVLNIF